MEDPQLKESMDPSKMPFDGKRMFWGGFETITELGAGRGARCQETVCNPAPSPRSITSSAPERSHSAFAV
jgi:hypothetical protein